MTALSISPAKLEDDFGQPIHHTLGEVLYDAKTNHGGAWALMTETSWKHHRRSAKLGTGFGQKYQLGEDGVWRKVEG
ncbi:MAG: hypothetical protein M0R28_20245 [Pigmentiphaga sp.]|nr:hypothetical protein [Pigmentiphaga sp.]